MKRLNEILARMAEIKKELDGFTELARSEDFEGHSDEDNATIDALLSEFDDLEAEAAPLRKRAEGLERIRNAPASMIETSDPLGEPGSLESVRTNDQLWDRDALARDDIPTVRAKALDAIERTRGMRDVIQEQATRFVETLEIDDDDPASATGAHRVLRHLVATSDPEYQMWFARYLKAGIRGKRHVEAEQYLQRAMSLTDASGGYAVPLPVDPTLNITGDGSSNPFRRISRVIPIVTDVLRSVNTTAVSFSWDGEAAQVSDDATTFGNEDITAHKAQGFIPYSIESGEDIPNFTGLVTAIFSEGRDNLEATAFATGSGSSQPFGVVTAKIATTLTSDATDTFDVGEVYKLIDTLGDKYDENASFVANKAIYSLIRQFDTGGGASLWVRLGAGQPPELVGYPAYRASGMDGSVTASAENYILILGDFSNYWIANRIGFSVEAIPHLFATQDNRPSGQRGLYAYWRVGADVVNNDAFELLNVT